MHHVPNVAQDPNVARMRQSCDRIAAVLGIREASGQQRPSSNKRSAAPRDSKSPPRPAMTNFAAVASSDYASMPTQLSRIPRGDDGQPSAYKSLREKSPGNGGNYSTAAVETNTPGLAKNTSVSLSNQ